LGAEGLPVIYVVTPTYRRPEQVPELTRMAQTLLNVPAIHWIVVEDNNSTTPAIRALLDRYGMPYTHLNGNFILIKFQVAGLRQVAGHELELVW
jgi:Glycosyltransferase family 43